MATCNASTLLAANPFTRLDPGLAQACKLQLLCDISSSAGGGTIGGSGTAGTLAKFTAGTTLGDSIISESGAVASVAGGVTMTGQLAINRGTLTALSPAIDITSTWNNAAVTFTGFRYNVTNTASLTTSLLFDWQVGGNPLLTLSRIGTLTCGGSIRAGLASLLGWSDAAFSRIAANAIGMVSSTSAQKFEVYNTFTSSTNYERGVFDWQTTANVLRIGTEKGSGGGTARDAVIVTDGTERMRADINGNVVVNTAAIATNATNGFLYVPSCAGTPTGVPTTFTGRVPIVVDTTNNKLYFYSGAAWRDAGP